MSREDFEGLSRHLKEVRLQRQSNNTDEIIQWCNSNSFGCRIRVIAEHQLRVYNDHLKIDVFTQSKKYHHITKNERGRINGKISDFLTKQFK